MSYQSFFIGFMLLVLILTVVYSVVGRILEQRDSILYPMVELYICLLIGVIYSGVAVCISMNWVYVVRVLVGLALGIVVGWVLMMTVGLCTSLLMVAIKLKKTYSTKQKSANSVA